MDRTPPKVGDKLYALNVGNAARYKEQKLSPVKVSRVGRKYFYIIQGWYEDKFYIDNWTQVTEYTPDTALYTSIEEWENEKEKNALIDDITRLTRHDLKNVSLDNLRKILLMSSSNDP